MTTLEGLAAGCAQWPYAHLPWQVFADYWDENGQPGVAEIIRKSLADRNPEHYSAYSTNPRPDGYPEYAKYHVPDTHPIGEPSAFLTMAIGHRGKPNVGVNVLFRLPGKDNSLHHDDGHISYMGPVKGHGVSVEPEEAKRLLSSMTGVRNADVALADLHRRFPALLLPPETTKPKRKKLQRDRNSQYAAELDTALHPDEDTDRG